MELLFTNRFLKHNFQFQILRHIEKHKQHFEAREFCLVHTIFFIRMDLNLFMLNILWIFSISASNNLKIFLIIFPFQHKYSYFSFLAKSSLKNGMSRFPSLHKMSSKCILFSKKMPRPRRSPRYSSVSRAENMLT